MASDETNYFFETMNQIVEVEPLRPGLFFTKESEKNTAKSQLTKLKKLRNDLRMPEKKGKALVPTKVISKKSLMKVNMKVWMEASKCPKNANGTYPYVDPLTAGVKAGNGLYFAKEGTKFLPACNREDDGDDDDSESSAGTSAFVKYIIQARAGNRGD